MSAAGQLTYRGKRQFTLEDEPGTIADPPAPDEASAATGGQTASGSGKPQVRSTVKCLTGPVAPGPGALAVKACS